MREITDSPPSPTGGETDTDIAVGRETAAKGGITPYPHVPALPMASTEVPDFNYALLPPDIAAKARETAARVRRRQTTMTIEAIGSGRELTEMKNLLKRSNGHGHWTDFLNRGCRMSERTAEQYMSVYRELGSKTATVAVLRPTTAYDLAAKSTPARIRDDVVRALEAGEPLTEDEIKSKIREGRSAEKLKKAEQREANRRAKLSTSGRRARQRREEEERREQERRRAEQAAREEKAVKAVDFLFER
jgi:hypothetical protein